MDSLRIFHNFRLNDLSESWIKSVWDAEFVIYDEPPDDYLLYLESDDVRLLLQKSCLVLRDWIAANECERSKSSEFSWQALMLLNINMRGLLAILGYIMKTGQSANNDQVSRQACLEATSLYLLFLTIPGSNAFRIYHPNLYQRAIETLKMSENLFPATERNITDTTDSGMDDELPDYYLLDSERAKLTESLNRIITDLIAMSKFFWFKDHAESLDITVRTLLDITKLEMHVKICNNNYKIKLLSQKASAALRELCGNNHGTVTLTITLIVQYMLPDLLFNHANAQPKSVTIVHEAAIYFLKSLLNVHENETVQVIVTLMHHLMVKCPERLEGRQRQATLIIKLLNMCGENVVVKIFKDIVLFSYNTKISYRLFAQEIIGKLLTEAFLSNGDLNKHIKMKMRKILIAVVLSRCADRSPLVRGKAMATLTSVSDCTDNDDESILRSIFETSTPNKAFLTFDELKRSFAKDVVDPLPGSNTLVLMFLDRINDERALVRRSALKIFRNLSIMFPSLMSKVTHVISDRCRDPTLTVRQFAVHVLSEILERFPHNLSLLDVWVQAVVPQIYDIEAKVQEKVLECLEIILIKKITSADLYVPDVASNCLPWRVLDTLSKMRMTKHLSKACGLWIRNSVITKSVISNLQSHIGTDNTISAWILLAALAENMKIPNINRHIADYKEIIQKNDFHASLMLQVLRHTWSTLDRDRLEDLRQHFYECISQFKIKSNLIGICLDILAGVLRHLHADNSLIESNMTKLLELSEAEIGDLRLEEHESHENILVKSRAVFTLGHASLLCTHRISSSTLRTLAKLLLHWDSLPESLKEMKELQASAVVLLCQQGLRDRDVAKQVTRVFSTLISQETDSSSPTKIAIKINAAKALADICVRFTALVEPYLTDMCISMKDSNPAVREAIVVIFIQLLLEDFIKLKGRFFFHILTMLSDTDKMIRELTIFLVEERLLAKNKTLISQQFLGSIYHYNDYRSQNAFCNGHRMRDQEKKLLTLPGIQNQDKRNVIYEFMLEHLDAPAKYELTAKLTRHVLREVCDGNSIDITTEEGACVLRDTVFIMNNQRMQLSSFSEKHRDDTAELDETIGANSSSAMNNNGASVAVTAIKRHNLENLLPTLITLKKKLATLKSSLEGDVESLLFKIYSEYEKEHLFTLLSEYPELEKEMDSYQRRLKDKTIPENDNSSANISTSSSVTNYKELLLSASQQKIPEVRLRRLSLNSGHCLRITASSDTVIADSKHLETVLETPPPEPNFSTSTPLLIRSPKCNDSAKKLLRKRSLSNHAILTNSSPRKVLKSSAN
ncbi:condensin-2 complex subunit D3-like [Pseudomyrmex gracilis]|uniref:condensin-2 complex subunit D3-like n=1 Tax=Pseudomyrmex gracilis TaxID=219809 RepID=UPI0009949C83|nr:condensin-2 complex subunit D3-like [Pseudomyrmex gracilis]